MTKILGAHLSISKGLFTVEKQMKMINCETCALFLKNQRTFNFQPLEQDVINKFKKTVQHPELLLPHASYLINLANDKDMKGYHLMIDDLKRCNALGINLYNIHPGSNTQKNITKAINNIADNINRAHKEVDNVIICLENMAGQGNTIGRRFEELKQIIDLVYDKSRIGITLDTCHLFGGGYDIRTFNSFENTMQEFNSIIGLQYLKAMHLNDSKMELNSRKDRHEELGKGKIGIDCFKFIMTSEYFINIPMILETPNPENYKNEIALLKSFTN